MLFTVTVGRVKVKLSDAVQTTNFSHTKSAPQKFNNTIISKHKSKVQSVTMARSKEAIRRRAQKRNRTVEEQQKIDWQTHQKQLEQREEHEKGRNTTNNHDGASSLSCCHANKTTNPVTSSPEHRDRDLVGDKSESLNGGAGTAASSSRQGSPDSLRRRQSNTTTPTTTNPSWGKQADANTIEGNRRLRQEYLKTGGIGMSLADQERARILIARDERKHEKKQRHKTSCNAS